MEPKDLLIKQEGKVLSITLNRPDVLNAFSLEMKEGLIDALNMAKINPEIGAILLTGAGRSFCSGGDIKRMGGSTPVSTYDYLGISKELILAMSNLEIPIVTAVQGYAAGAGACLALASDIILAAEDSQFFFSFSKLGLIPDGGGLFFLPRTLGLYRAKEVLFRARPIDASTALQWGIVNHLYPVDNLFEEAMIYAQELANGPTRAIGQIKRIANRALVNDLSDVLQMEQTTQAIIQTTEDHKEGVRAFKEKRTPKFQGK